MKNIISIIVPVYGEIQSLTEFESWINGLSDFEGQIGVVISYDSTGSEISKYNLKTIKDLNVAHCQILEGNFGGPGRARNAALDVVNADWIVFCDADDVPDLKKIKSLVEKAIDLSSEVAIGSYKVKNSFNQKEIFHILKTQSSLRNAMYISKNPGIWRFAFNRNSMDDIRFPDLRMGEDQLFLMEYFKKNRNVLFSREIIYTYYRGVSGQLTSQLMSKKELVKCLELAKEIVEKSESGKSFSNELLLRMYRRQSLSVLKHSDNLDRIHGMYHLLASIVFQIDSMISSILRKN